MPRRSGLPGGTCETIVAVIAAIPDENASAAGAPSSAASLAAAASTVGLARREYHHVSVPPVRAMSA